jgi:hypothetical protein
VRDIQYRFLLLFVSIVLPCSAQNGFVRSVKSVGHHFGKLEWSQTALVGADIADAWSSTRPGVTELNPLLAQRGQFTATSALIKFSMVGAQILGQHYILKHHPAFAQAGHLETIFTITNYAGAGMYTGIAVHNATLK